MPVPSPGLVRPLLSAYYATRGADDSQRINRPYAKLLRRDRLGQPRRQLIQVQFAWSKIDRGTATAMNNVGSTTRAFC